MQFSGTTEHANAVRWSFGTGEVSTEHDPGTLFTDPGTYRVKLTALGDEGRYASDEQLIEVFPSPVARFEIVEGIGVDGALESLDLVNFSDGSDSWMWKMVDAGGRPSGSWSSDKFQPSVAWSGLQPGDSQVRLVAQNEFGCADTSFTEIPGGHLPEKPTLRFPTAFSPSPTGPSGGIYEAGERRIDLFYPIGSETPAEYSLQLFSRMGELVYESQNFYRGWDGYLLQERAKGGVYLWMVSGKWEDGTTFRMKGDVTMIWSD